MNVVYGAPRPERDVAWRSRPNRNEFSTQSRLEDGEIGEDIDLPCRSASSRPRSPARLGGLRHGYPVGGFTRWPVSLSCGSKDRGPRGLRTGHGENPSPHERWAFGRKALRGLGLFS
jgi:hypothetical protein